MLITLRRRGRRKVPIQASTAFTRSGWKGRSRMRLPVACAKAFATAATAGPCGVWPDDLGPNIANPDYNENKQYYNFGCATQRNLAVMVANPSDLVQPRAETPAYTMRRTEGFDQYRKGEPTTTVYPDADKAKLSDAGK